MSLSTALQKLMAVEAGLQVEVDGRQHKIVRAYRGNPPAPDSREVPCFMHPHWSLLDPNPLADGYPNGFRQLNYTVRVSALIGDAMTDGHLWAEVADAFHDAFQDALALNLKLGDSAVEIRNLRSNGDATRVVIDYDGLPYVGLDYLLDIRIQDVITVGAGN